MPNLSQSQSDVVRNRFASVDTSNVADVLDKRGYLYQALSAGFGPYPVSAGKLAGWAYTICGQMTPYEISGDAEKMKACQGLVPGQVSVWSGDGEGICYFGELIAIGMRERGCVGALVDGGIRDVRWIGEQDFPVYARYRTPVQSIGRWKVNAWQIPVYLDGATSRSVRVNPGDFILGDDDGVIVIPVEVVEDVLAEAEQLTATEVTIRTDLKTGKTLEQCLRKFGNV
jgi:4-hydroxy-4-methyl-2-oxoglutarate aldolase